LTTKDGVQIEKDVNNNRYSLTIPKVNPSIHAGMLTIKATNPICSVTHEISLNILGIYILIWELLFFGFYFYTSQTLVISF
jgi:hypothetical protein